MNKVISNVTKGMAFVCLFGAVAGPARVSADDFLYEFNHTFSGTSPAGGTPWVTAEFKDVGLNTVDLTFTGSGLQGSEYVDELYLNLNPTMDPTQLSITDIGSSGSFALPSDNTGANQFQADGDGIYDIKFNFATSNGSRFMAGDSVTIQLTDANGLNADDFDFGSQMGGGNGSWLAAAHINSIGNGQSGWDAPTQLTPVPEPGTLALMGMGFAGALALRRRNRK